MIVCIAEKPSVARDIAKVLGAHTVRSGYMEGNGYCVTWTFGHLCTLKEPGDYNPFWKSWTLSQLPMIPQRFGIKLLQDRGIEEQFATIRGLMSQATEVINCGDAGQEGELIQRWVMQLAECKCPVRRLWLSSMTEEAIKEAFGNLKDQKEYQNLYYAGLSRAIGDWILGFNATRLYTLKYAQPRQVISVGRVQTPTLALIVERFEEIRDFVPQPFWEIKTLYRNVTFNSTKGRFEDKEEALKVIEAISQEELVVKDIKKKKGKEGPPRLFDLTSLQIECNKKFNYSADETLNAIQGLYESKLVTYPRVDTTYLTNDIYPKLPGIFNSLKTLRPELIAPLLGKKLPKTKKVFDDTKVTDHHAIIPTGYVPGMLNKKMQDVYDTILLRFIAAFYPDLLFEQTTVMAKIAKYEFKATGRVVTDRGWRTVYDSLATPEPTEGEEEEDSGASKELPVFQTGEHGPHKPDLLEKQTQPPKNYTEATLLNAMETAGKLVDDDDLKDAMKQKGIGRPSTRAAIIETLFKRNYIYKERKALLPTDLGIQLIHLIKNELLKSVRLTGEWEYKLRLIDQGEYSAETFLNELKAMVQQLVGEVRMDTTPREVLLQSARKRVKEGDECPICHEGVVLKGNKAFGCSRYKEGCSFRQPFND